MPEVLAALDLALPSATELPVSKSRDAGPATLGRRCAGMVISSDGPRLVQAGCRAPRLARAVALGHGRHDLPDARQCRQSSPLWRPSVRERQGSQLSAGAGGQRHGHPHASRLGHRFWRVWSERDVVRQDAGWAYCRSFPHRLRPGLSLCGNSVGANPVGPGAPLSDPRQVEHEVGSALG